MQYIYFFILLFSKGLITIKPIIRFAHQSDAAGILEIYAPYVLSTPVTFEVTVPKEQDFKLRIDSISASMPYLVCEIDGKIAGFAYAGAHKAAPAFSWNTSVNVYISDTYQRCNIASALYLAIISLLKAQGYRSIYAIVTASDVKSEAFHNAFGFSKVATLENVGYKFGAWHSLSIFEKQLDTSDKAPVTTKSISQLDSAFCERNFRQCEKIIKIKH